MLTTLQILIPTQNTLGLLNYSDPILFWEKYMVNIVNKISNFHPFVYPDFSSFLLRLQRKISLNPAGPFMLYKLFQHE